MSNLIRSIIDSEFELLTNLMESKNKIYTFLNPVSFLTAVKQKSLFQSFDGIFADGSLMTLAIRLLYWKKVERRSFDMTSMAPELLSFANKNKKSVCIVATKQEMLDKTLSIFRNQYPDIEWRGCRNGYFSGEEEMRSEASRIALENADYLIVGMGVGMQEKFLMMCIDAGYQGIGFTCGGFVHQTAEHDGKADYYPKWIDKLNLRFLYRFVKEPHTRKRYLQAFFVFPFVFLKERLFS